jgi:hypothetical protein
MCSNDSHLLFNSVSCAENKGGNVVRIVSTARMEMGIPKLPWRVGSGEGYIWQFSTDVGPDRMGICVHAR